MRAVSNWMTGSGLLVSVVSVAIAAMVGCAEVEGDGPGEGSERVRVVVSILPLGSLAQQIVGEAGEVDVLLPPGRSPHGFELTANQVRRLAEADVVLVVGGGVDPWAAQAAERSGRAVMLIEMHELMVEVFDLEDAPHDHDDHHHDHDHHHGPINPHHWLDPLRVAAFVSHVGDRLAEQHPHHRATLERNVRNLLATIDEVDDAYREALVDVRRRELITFHNAFDPLAERYGLRVIAHLTPIELTPGGEVTPRRLRNAIEAIESYDLPVVYAEPQFPDRAIEALSDQTRAAILRLDPIGHPRREGYQTWQATMRSNLEVLVDGQNRSR